LRKPKPLTSEAQAFRYAIWLLSRRGYSSGELKEKFCLKSLSTELQDKIIERLILKKFLNDHDFTDQFVRSKMAQNWGPRKIQAAFQKKRIPREMGEKALARAFPSADEKEQAKTYLFRQKQRFLRKKEKKAGDNLRKAFEFLIRKGYSLEAARLAVKDVFSYNSDLLSDRN